jgi:hypothetical protein
MSRVLGRDAEMLRIVEAHNGKRHGSMIRATVEA